MKKFRIVGTDHGVFIDTIVTAKDRMEALEMIGITHVIAAVEV